MRKKLTKPVVDALTPGTLVWDTEVSRFGIRRRAGARVYLVKYRHHGRQRWKRIGEHGSPWTVATARREALRLLGLVAQDQDPVATAMAARTAPTVAALCDRFLSEHAPKKKPSTKGEYRNTIASIIRPKLGHLHIAGRDARRSGEAPPCDARDAIARQPESVNKNETAGFMGLVLLCH